MAGSGEEDGRDRRRAGWGRGLSIGPDRRAVRPEPGQRERASRGTIRPRTGPQRHLERLFDHMVEYDMSMPPLAALDTPDLDTASGVLSFARQQRAAADLAEARLLITAVEWCVLHPAESVHAAASWDESFGDQAIGSAGEGAPLVSEFAVAEFAAAVGKSTDGGRAYLGEALELRYRLPKLWQRVVDGDLAAWKARHLAQGVMLLLVVKRR